MTEGANRLGALVAAELPYQEYLVLPGIGALVSRYTPATLHPMSLVVYPPNLEITLNTRLSESDGVLYAAFLRNLADRTQSEQQFQSALAEAKSAIDSAKGWQLGKHGTLIRDLEGYIVLNRSAGSQLLRSAFGTEPIALHEYAKARPTATEITLQRPAATGMQRKPLLQIAAAIAFLAISGLGIWKFMPTAKSPSANANRTESAASLAIPLATTSTEVAPAIEAEKPTAPHSIAQPELSTTPEIASTPDSTYYLIAGMFKSEANAKRLVNTLTAGGLQAQLAGLEPQRGLHRVACAKFSSRKAATAQRPAMRTATGEAVWVLATAAAY